MLGILICSETIIMFLDFPEHFSIDFNSLLFGKTGYEGLKELLTISSAELFPSWHILDITIKHTKTLKNLLVRVRETLRWLSHVMDSDSKYNL